MTIEEAKKEGVKEIMPRLRGAFWFHKIDGHTLDLDTIDDILTDVMWAYLNDKIEEDKSSIP